jgi:hypothetical protein
MTKKVTKPEDRNLTLAFSYKPFHLLFIKGLLLWRLICESLVITDNFRGDLVSKTGLPGSISGIHHFGDIVLLAGASIRAIST